MTDVSWIAADWGTTNLRVWAMSQEDEIVAHASSDRGMNSLAPHQFEEALLELAGVWLEDGQKTLVMACGMVGARQGWIEADYVAVPAPPLTAGGFASAHVTDPRLRVLIVPGLAQHDPADVMRGEETQIAGLLAQRPDFDGSVCMPGTHSKWAVVRNGRILSFRTFLTGELFALLERKSILRHSLGTEGIDGRAFDETVAESLDSSEPAIANLFSIRAEDLLNGVPSPVSRAKLSAYLISAEIRTMKPDLDGRKVILIASDELGGLYRQGLEAAGAEAEMVDGSGLAVLGLIAAKALVEKHDGA